MLNFPERLSNPDKLIIDAKEILINRKAEQQLSKIIAYMENEGNVWKAIRLQPQKEEDIRKEKERLQREFPALQEKI